MRDFASLWFIFGFMTAQACSSTAGEVRFNPPPNFKLQTHMAVPARKTALQSRALARAHAGESGQSRSDPSRFDLRSGVFEPVQAKASPPSTNLWAFATGARLSLRDLSKIELRSRTIEQDGQATAPTDLVSRAFVTDERSKPGDQSSLKPRHRPLEPARMAASRQGRGPCFRNKPIVFIPVNASLGSVLSRVSAECGANISIPSELGRQTVDPGQVISGTPFDIVQTLSADYNFSWFLSGENLAATRKSDDEVKVTRVSTQSANEIADIMMQVGFLYPSHAVREVRPGMYAVVGSHQFIKAFQSINQMITSGLGSDSGPGRVVIRYGLIN